MFNNKKATALGGALLIGIIFFNIVMYLWIASINQDPLFNVDSSGSINKDGLSVTNPFSWTDGFKISVFGMPDWFDYFYVTFQSVLLIIGSWYAFKGN